MTIWTRICYCNIFSSILSLSIIIFNHNWKTHNLKIKQANKKCAKRNATLFSTLYSLMSNRLQHWGSLPQLCLPRHSLLLHRILRGQPSRWSRTRTLIINNLDHYLIFHSVLWSGICWPWRFAPRGGEHWAHFYYIHQPLLYIWPTKLNQMRVWRKRRQRQRKK